MYEVSNVKIILAISLIYDLSSWVALLYVTALILLGALINLMWPITAELGLN